MNADGRIGRGGDPMWPPTDAVTRVPTWGAPAPDLKFERSTPCQAAAHSRDEPNRGRVSPTAKQRLRMGSTDDGVLIQRRRGKGAIDPMSSGALARRRGSLEG